MIENKSKYNKPALTIDEHIRLLKSRGLEINNNEEIRYYLKNISYYHLSIYFKHFQNRENDKFYKGISFGDILRIYIFDNKLRFLLLELLERIEKSFKARMAYELSIEKSDPHWYLNENLFIDKNKYKEILRLITEEVEKSSEESVRHYRRKYFDPVLPPIWTSLEILSFGQCVKICKALKREYRNKISRSFGEDEKFIMSWMHCLSILRNNCAHHSRLWNRELIFMPKINHKIYGVYFNIHSRRLYNHLVILQIILSKINPSTSWVEKLKKLIFKHKINILNMGFTIDWEYNLNKIIGKRIK